MKKFLGLVIIYVFCLVMPLYAGSIDNEVLMHYNMAEKYYNEGNFQESARVLNEIINYYDTQNLKAYKLLIKAYKKLGENQKVKEVKKLYTHTKKAVSVRLKTSPENMTIPEILKNGLPKEKILACKTIEKENKEQYIPDIPDLINLFADPYFDYYYSSYDVRKAAVKTVVSFGPKALPHLIKAFESSDNNIRFGVIDVCRQLETADLNKKNQIFELYKKAVKDDFINVKLIGIESIGKSSNPEFIPYIIKLSGDSDDNVKMFLAAALGNLSVISKEYANQSVETLFKLLEDKNKGVINQAVISLAKIGGNDIADRLIEIAKDDKKETIIRWYAIKGMGTLLSQKNTEELKKILNDESDFWLRSAAAAALGEKSDSTKDEVTLQKEKDIFDETALKFSLKSPFVYEEARLGGIEKAMKYLESIQNKDGSFSSYFPLGTTELAVLCFQKQGYDENYPLIKKGIEYILSNRRLDGSFFDKSVDKKITFTTALAVKVLAGTKNSKYRDIIKDAMNWIKNVQAIDGGFGYYKDSRPDITCTTFATDALDCGYAYWGMEKNDEVWINALNYLKKAQNDDGGFGYAKDMNPNSYGSATSSGFLSLQRTGADNVSKEKTFKWISTNYNWDKNPYDQNPAHYQYYIQELANALHLYGKEIIKDKEGVSHYWYQDVVKKLLSEQDKNGWWVTKEEPLFTTYLINVLQLQRLKNNLKNM